MIVTIDGGVASGKSAVGRRVAEKHGLPFIDSGLMYRALTRLAADRGIDPHDADAMTRLAESTPIRIDGERVDEESMRKEVEMRDRVDSNRRVAPLRPADDAVIIDTDQLDLDEVVDRIVRQVREGRSSTPSSARSCASSRGATWPGCSRSK